MSEPRGAASERLDLLDQRFAILTGTVVLPHR
jgi:hypothetical protein